MTRPDKETVLRLLAANGKTVTMTDHKLTEDANGWPLGVEQVEYSGVLAVSVEALGWTRAELGLDDEDDE